MNIKGRDGVIVIGIAIVVVAAGYAIFQAVANRSTYSPNSPSTLLAIKHLETDPKSVTPQDRAVWASMPADQRRQIGQDAMNKAMGGRPLKSSK